MIESVRARLTLWYCGLLAIVLVTFGLVSYARIARAIRAETDASLSDTAHELSSAFRQIAAEEQAGSREVPLDFRYSDRTLLIVGPDGGVLASSRSRELDAAARAEVARRVSRGARGFFDVRAGRSDGGFRALAIPITVVSQPFVAVVARSLADENLRLSNAAGALFYGIPVALLVAGAGGYLLARGSLAPVLRISRKALEIGASNLGERIEIQNPRDELGVLATTINGLLARLEEAFESQRRFMAEASHELRTPLSILQGEADVALSRSDRESGEYREALEIVQKTCRNITQIVEDLFLLSRGDTGSYPVRRVRFYLDETATDCARAMRTLADSRGVAIDVEPGSERLVYGDEELIRRLFLNLLDNAVKHTRRGGSVRVRLERAGASDRIVVSDEGPGVPLSERHRIFERFYRGSGNGFGRGAGLGLAIARSIAHLHGGEVRLEDSSPAGSTFVAELAIDVS
jgi:heavy metal sensor kinase